MSNDGAPVKHINRSTNGRPEPADASLAVHSGGMQQQLVQFLAAMANRRARSRFAELTLAGDGGAPADGVRDRLLLAAGVLSQRPDGSVRVDESALVALLAHARDTVAPRPAGKIDLLPRQRKLRRAVLRGLAEAVLDASERIPERELNARLAERVLDIPGVRRALIDEGILDREADGSSYWRVAEG